MYAIDYLIHLLSKETNKVKGDAIEDLAKYIFTAYPNICNTDRYFKYGELSDQYRTERRLPRADKGIDGVIIRSDGSEYAVQAKYRNNQDYKLVLDELSTFLAWTGNTMINNRKCYTKGVIVCTCRVTNDIPNSFPDSYLLFDYDALTRMDDIVREFTQLYIQDHFNAVINAPPRPIPKQPRGVQTDIIHAANVYFNAHKSGKIIAPCGIGKTLISYWIQKSLNAKTVVVFVPSLELLSQVYLNWMRENTANGNLCKYLLIGSDAARDYGEFVLSTDIGEICAWFDTNITPQMPNCYIFSTYASSEILTKAIVDRGVEIDLAVYDEVHRLVSGYNSHNISLRNDDLQFITKRNLFLTATEKVIHGDANFISMDQPIFGDYIYKYSLRQAIDDGLLCDYKILAIFANNLLDNIINSETFNYVVGDIDEYKAEYAIAAMAVLVAIRDHDVKHIILYSNTDRSAKNMEKCIKYMLHKSHVPDDDKVFVTTITSNDNKRVRETKKRDFAAAKIGIISSVRIFNEGVDIPKCDAEVFVEPRNSSVDIIQCIGRGLRLDPNNPNKICKIIIPLLTPLDTIDILDNGIYGKYEKLFNILKELYKHDNKALEVLYALKVKNIVGINTRDYGSETVYTKINENFIGFVKLGVFGAAGSRDNQLRSLLILYNEDHVDYPLITRHECISYLLSLGIDKSEIPNIKNWPKFALNTKQYAHIKELFYKRESEIYAALIRLNIKSYEEYKSRHYEDKKLPSIELIDSGLYHDDNLNINICAYFHTDNDPIDF